jgi:hypothetical protein
MITTKNNTIGARVTIAFDLDTLNECKHTNPELQDECQSFIYRIYALKVEYKEFVEMIKHKRIEVLEMEHDKAVDECTAASDVYTGLVYSRAGFEEMVRQADAKVSNAQFHWRVQKESRPAPPFAKRSDIAAWEAKVSAAQGSLEEAQRQQFKAHADLNGVNASIGAAKSKLNQLKETEAGIRSELNSLTGDQESQQPSSRVNSNGLPGM